MQLQRLDEVPREQIGGMVRRIWGLKIRVVELCGRVPKGRSSVNNGFHRFSYPVLFEKRAACQSDSLFRAPRRPRVWFVPGDARAC